MIVLKATQDKILSILQSMAGIVERRHALPTLANVLTRADELQFVEISAAVLLHAPRKQLNPVRSMSYGAFRELTLGESCVGLFRREESARNWQVISDSGPNQGFGCLLGHEMECQ